MIKRGKIGIDLDDVLNDLLTEWLRLYNIQYNDTLLYNDFCKEWNLINNIKPECGDKIYEILSIKGLFYNLNVKDINSIEIIKELSKYHDIFIITAYTSEHCIDKTRFIQKYYPFINLNNIIFCNYKYLINVDYLIDDYYANFDNFKGKKILYNAPYNQHYKNIDIRVNDWNDIKKYFIEEKILLNDIN
jgi:5'(3')-deoxyribonucleotidase